MKRNIRLNTLTFLVIILSLSSCVTNRNLEYVSTDNNTQSVKSTSFNYIIQKEDLLSVQISSTTKSDYDFFNLKETSNPQLMSINPYFYGYLVKQDGIVNLPMIGNVKVEGFTINEVEKVIEQISSTYFKDPIVKVNIINFKVSILGEVNNPGEYNIVRSNQNLLHLIGKANDLTEFANRRKIKVIRNNGEYSSKIIYLNLTDPLVLNDKNFYLNPQDIVYVEPMKKKFYSVKSLSNAVSVSISAITLYLLINN